MKVGGERLKCGDFPGKGLCGACLGVKLILSPGWEPWASRGEMQSCSASLVTLESTSAVIGLLWRKIMQKPLRN